MKKIEISKCNNCLLHKHENINHICIYPDNNKNNITEFIHKNIMNKDCPLKKSDLIIMLDKNSM